MLSDLGNHLRWESADGMLELRHESDHYDTRNVEDMLADTRKPVCCAFNGRY
jgi:hypothetical protein